MLKIISTLSLNSINYDNVKKLMPIVEKFRLNASHFSANDLNKALLSFSEIFKLTGEKRQVVVDLKGAKVRIGKYKETTGIPDLIYIKNIENSENIKIIPLPDEMFFKAIKIGDLLYLNDAEVILKVMNTNDDEIVCKTLKSGKLSSNKGINIKNHPVKYENITDFDKETIEVSNSYEFTEYAFSFVYDGNEYNILKKYTDKRITAKIERPESLNYLKDIDENFDEIWFCRGDMGAQAGLENLGRIQYEFSQKVKMLKSEVYLAGQVLHSITKFEVPTRTEIVSLYLIEQEGYAGIVLSDETVNGVYIDRIIDFIKQFK